MEFRFDRREPGVWISAGTHVRAARAGAGQRRGPGAAEAQEGVPVEVITENQFSEITKGERQADKPMPNATSRADRKAEKFEDREPENAKTDAPTAPTRTAEMKLANAEEMPLRGEPDPQEAAQAAKAAQEKRDAEKAAAKARKGRRKGRGREGGSRQGRRRPRRRPRPRAAARPRPRSASSWRS